MRPDENLELTVVIVDDSIDDHYFIKKALAEYKKINFISLYDGDSLIKYLREKQAHKSSASTLPDVVILDINMPKLNGFETFSELKNEDLCSNIKFFILASSITDSDSKKCRSLNLDCYTKPFTVKNFQLLLEKILVEYYPPNNADNK